MSGKEVVLTYEGLKKLEEELEFLKSSKRREIADKIKQAMTYGDISENAEYDEAKNEQAHLENRIAQLESMLKHAKIIDEDDVNTDKVSIGSKVKLKYLDTDEEATYYIVGSTEANPGKSKISNESPVGSALLGHSTGDVIEAKVPDGIIRFKILSITK